jgi:hypothetical protein
MLGRFDTDRINELALAPIRDMPPALLASLIGLLTIGLPGEPRPRLAVV